MLETIRVLIKNTEQMTQNTRQAVEEMKAHRNQQADILKEEKEEAQEEEPPPIYDHSYSHPNQQYQEEPPSPTMAALEETMDVLEEISVALERTMSAFRSEAEEDGKNLQG